MRALHRSYAVRFLRSRPLNERHDTVNAPDPTRGDQRGLDQALAASFPASDPPAATAAAIASHPPQGARDPAKLLEVFRVVPRAQSHAAFASAENRSGGRWTSPGVPAVYASLTPAGAVLEFLAHMDGEKPADLTLVTATMPAACLVDGDALPARWRERPYREDVREYGNQWVRSRRSLALGLPSVLCEQSKNLLINPEHDDIARLQTTRIEPFVLDKRLIES